MGKMDQSIRRVGNDKKCRVARAQAHAAKPCKRWEARSAEAGNQNRGCGHRVSAKGRQDGDRGDGSSRESMRWMEKDATDCLREALHTSSAAIGDGGAAEASV
eukprot:3573325-Pleurochrysis_carterae.AAC.3